MRRVQVLGGRMVRAGPLVDRRALLLGRFCGRTGAQSPVDQPELGPFLLQINSERCVGCDVCIRICPQEALRLLEQEERAFYVIDSGRCDGCGFCLELCERDAIEMLRGSLAPAPQLIELTERSCTGCGVPFHVPLKQVASGSLCQICAARALAESVSARW